MCACCCQSRLNKHSNDVIEQIHEGRRNARKGPLYYLYVQQPVLTPIYKSFRHYSKHVLQLPLKRWPTTRRALRDTCTFGDFIAAASHEISMAMF